MAETLKPSDEERSGPKTLGVLAKSYRQKLVTA